MVPDMGREAHGRPKGPGDFFILVRDDDFSGYFDPEPTTQVEKNMQRLLWNVTAPKPAPKLSSLPKSFLGTAISCV